MNVCINMKYIFPNLQCSFKKELNVKGKNDNTIVEFIIYVEIKCMTTIA